VIGNEQGYADLLHAAFAGTDSTIDLAPNEEAGDVRLAQAPHDLVILALPLPGADGPAVCRRLRAAGITAPIVMLDGRGLLADLVAGLEAGADSYVARPISVDELRAHLGTLAPR
jgi:DNA-binding response OmpR family regulator